MYIFFLGFTTTLTSFVDFPLFSESIFFNDSAANLCSLINDNKDESNSKAEKRANSYFLTSLSIRTKYK